MPSIKEHGGMADVIGPTYYTWPHPQVCVFLGIFKCMTQLHISPLKRSMYICVHLHTLQRVSM